MLTEKELQVLLLRKQGLLQNEIAERLEITQGAVSRFEANARKKIHDMRFQLELLADLSITDGEPLIGLHDKKKQLQEQLKRWER